MQAFTINHAQLSQLSTLGFIFCFNSEVCFISVCICFGFIPVILTISFLSEQGFIVCLHSSSNLTVQNLVNWSCSLINIKWDKFDSFFSGKFLVFVYTSILFLITYTQHCNQVCDLVLQLVDSLAHHLSRKVTRVLHSNLNTTHDSLNPSTFLSMSINLSLL